MPRQDSLYDQLKDVHKAAVAMGAYDAADFLAKQIGEIEKRTQGRKTTLALAGGGLDVLDKVSWEGMTVTLTRRVKDGAELLFIDHEGNKLSIGREGKVIWGEEALTPVEAKGKRGLLGSSFSIKVETWMKLKGGVEQHHVEISGESKHGMVVYLNGKMVYQQVAVNELNTAEAVERETPSM